VQNDKAQWPALKLRIAELFKARTRTEWCELMEGSEVCFAPVLTMTEAAAHPHNVARSTFVERSGRVQPAPAPRFSRTSPQLERLPAHAGQHTCDVLADWGFDAARIAELVGSGAIKQA
jgi:alpha-methylacyl-CoA racemase